MLVAQRQVDIVCAFVLLVLTQCQVNYIAWGGESLLLAPLVTQQTRTKNTCRGRGQDECWQTEAWQPA